ncbi:MAG: hypothetical protein WA705_03170 [Candidatus Ozemobacteraceae bacterium]
MENSSLAQTVRGLVRHGLAQGSPTDEAIARFCSNDCPEALRLPEETTGNRPTVFDWPHSEASRFLEGNGAGPHPSPEVLLRAARYFHLNATQALVFIFKGLWERFLNEPGADAAGKPRRDRQIDGLRFEFQPDTALLLPISDPALAAGLRVSLSADLPANPESLLRMVREIILNNLHMGSLFSLEMDRFAVLFEEELRLATSTPPEMWAGYLDLRNRQVACRWELERTLFTLEKRRIKDQFLRARWMAVFGEEFKKREQMSEEVAELEYQLVLLGADPTLTEVQLAAMTADYRCAFQSRQRSMEIEMQLGILLRETPMPTIPPASIAAWESTMKSTLFRVWKQVHPDVLERHPRFRNLSADQRGIIEDLQHRLSQMKTNDLTGKQFTPESRNEFLETLEAIALKVEKILQNAGIDLNVDLLPSGDSLTTRVEWLEKEIPRLETGIRNVRYQFEHLKRDSFMYEVRACLDRPGLHDVFRQNLLSHIELLEARVKTLRDQREALLARNEPVPVEPTSGLEPEPESESEPEPEPEPEPAPAPELVH